MRASHLEQIWHSLILGAHGLGAAEGGVGCHMDALLLAPVNNSLIPEMAVHFYLQSEHVLSMKQV